MILTAAWVVPVSTPPVRMGAVAIENGRITAVGRAADLVTARHAVTDLGNAILTPGLINPHAHLELTCYAGLLKPCSFWDWIPLLVRLRRAPGQIEREQGGVREGVRQSLRAGVTCVGDISRRNLNWRVLKDSPIRKVCFVELLSLADQPPRNLDELRAAAAEVEEDSLLTVGLTPHTPFTVPEDDIRATLELAAELRRPWCTHWAETPEELAFLQGDAEALPPFMQRLLKQCNLRSPRTSAIELLDRCCRGLPPGALAHFNYAQQGDGERLAAAGHAVVYCPRSHDFFGHSAHPFREFLEAGVSVAIVAPTVLPATRAFRFWMSCASCAITYPIPQLHRRCFRWSH